MSTFIELMVGQGGRPLTRRLRDACQFVTRPLAFLGVIGMLVASGATVVDVLLRWLANSGVSALNEIVAMTFAVTVTACLPAGLAAGVGVVIDAAAPTLSLRTAARLKAIGALLLLVVFFLLAWRMGFYAESLERAARTTVILGLPQAPFIWMTTALLVVATVVQFIVTLDLTWGAFVTPASLRRKAGDVIAYAGIGLMILGGLVIYFFFDSVSAWAQAHPAVTVLIGFLLMWLWLLGLVPLAAAIGFIGLVGTMLLIGPNPSLSAFATEASGFLTNYQVATLPLFLMMGSFAATAGVSDDVYRLAQALLGRFRGGLAMATIGGCAGFGAVTGSSLATVATFGRVSLPEMQARGYAPQFAAGCVAAGGTLGALIPPSGPLIIFALLTEASIGHLFVAAVVPGIIAALLYLAAISVTVRLDPTAAPQRERVGSQELKAAIRRCGAVVVLFGAVIGGMYSGVFTATEAAGVGAFGAFLIALVRGKLKASEFWNVMNETTASTAMIYTLIFGVLIFSFFVGVSALPEAATAYISTLELPPIMIVGMILLCFLLLGCVMDSFTVLIVTVPIVIPVILNMGYDIIWWGIINLAIVEMGLITPPFGLHLFVLKSMLPDVSLGKLYRGVLPFCTADALKLLLLFLFPILALWLPSTMR